MSEGSAKLEERERGEKCKVHEETIKLGGR